jgi:hypothetical protein
VREYRPDKHTEISLALMCIVRISRLSSGGVASPGVMCRPSVLFTYNSTSVVELFCKYALITHRRQIKKCQDVNGANSPNSPHDAVSKSRMGKYFTFKTIKLSLGRMLLCNMARKMSLGLRLRRKVSLGYMSPFEVINHWTVNITIDAESGMYVCSMSCIKVVY